MIASSQNIPNKTVDERVCRAHNERDWGTYGRTMDSRWDRRDVISRDLDQEGRPMKAWMIGSLIWVCIVAVSAWYSIELKKIEKWERRSQRVEREAIEARREQLYFRNTV